MTASGRARLSPLSSESIDCCSGMDQLTDVDVRPDLVVRLQARDFGIDGVGAPLARKRNTVVAVLDEVGTAYLEDIDRRHVTASSMSAMKFT
jgi:hypothetical protein